MLYLLSWLLPLLCVRALEKPSPVTFRGVVGWCGPSNNLDDSWARAACRSGAWGCLDIFTLVYPFSPLSTSGWLGDAMVLGKLPVPGRP